MKEKQAITSHRQADVRVKTVPAENKLSNPATTTQKRDDSAAQFVTKFTNHYQRCKALAKRFAMDNPELKDSAALSQLCRAAQEMLEQAKEARAMTKIYLALDDKHRDAVRPIIIARFRDILNSADASWRRFCDSTRFAPTARREIESAQRDFEPHANQFHETLQMFIALGDQAHQ